MNKVANMKVHSRPVVTAFKKGSGYRTTCWSLNLKPYLTAFCNMIVTHDESAVGLVETK